MRPSTDEQPLVSVVTPVYNTQDYLAECIESVLRQDYANFEYIIVNNKSTDRSSEIARNYAARDSRIRIVEHETFLTQPENYNHALKQISAKSTFCKIVQADDWIFPNCLSEMVRAGLRDYRVSVIGAYQLEGEKVKCSGLRVPGPTDMITIIDGREACRKYVLHEQYLFGTPTSVMYRSDLIRSRERFYREDSYFEDSEVCFEVLPSGRFAFVHQLLTFSRADNESIKAKWEGMDPYPLHYYTITKRYGALFLDESEHKSAIRSARLHYYTALARAALKRPGKDFWAFHRKGLAALGESINRLMILRQVLSLSKAWVEKPVRSLFGQVQPGVRP